MELTKEQQAEYAKLYPIMKDGKQIGYLIPTGPGEFSAYAPEDFDFTAHTLKAEPK